MPRNVRNWWVEARADGSKEIATGPQGSQGGVMVRVLARDRGQVVDSFIIEGRARGDELILTVHGPDGREIGRHVTHR